MDTRHSGPSKLQITKTILTVVLADCGEEARESHPCPLHWSFEPDNLSLAMVNYLFLNQINESTSGLT